MNGVKWETFLQNEKGKKDWTSGMPAIEACRHC